MRLKLNKGFTPLEIPMVYTYVLKSKKDNKWYTGCTNNLQERFKQHNNGEISSTKNRGPFELIYYEACNNEKDAYAREKYLKTGMGKKYLKNRLKRSLFLTGFTIVELLVVVSVIAVLAAIVLFNVTPYINKAKNSAIKANLSTVLVNFTLYFNTNSNYTGFCTSTAFTRPQDAITEARGTAICNVSITGGSVCACSTLVGTSNTFCVDNTGTKKEASNNCATECPAVEALCQ